MEWDSPQWTSARAESRTRGRFPPLAAGWLCLNDPVLGELIRSYAHPQFCTRNRTETIEVPGGCSWLLRHQVTYLMYPVVRLGCAPGQMPAGAGPAAMPAWLPTTQSGRNTQIT